MKQARTGTGVLVTRPRKQSGELIQALKHAGCKTFQLPVIEIVPFDPDVVMTEACTLPTPDIVIFVSQNAVLSGAAAVRRIASESTSIAAIGSATCSALLATGSEIHISPGDKFDSEQLLVHPQLQRVEGKQVLVVRGNSGRELLAETLTARGASVNYLATYERKTAAVDAQELKKLMAEWHNGAIQVVIVMSVDSLSSLLKILPADNHDLLRNTRLVTPSKRVIQTAAESLPGIDAVLADSPRAESLINAINQ